MSKPRKSPAERVADFKARAEQIERREARKLRAQSPQWKAILRAMQAMADAAEVMKDSNDEQDHELRDVIGPAFGAFVSLREAQIDKE